MFPEELGIKFGDYVRSIKTDSYSLTDRTKIIIELQKHLEQAIEKRIIDKKTTAIAFSGGLDSSIMALIASKHVKGIGLLAVGFENSSDMEYAKKISKFYNWNLRTRVISLQEAEEIVKRVVGILKTDDIVKVGVGCVVHSVLGLAKQNNMKTVLGGLGAEEIFAGYDRHRKKHIENPESVHEECWRGLENLYAQDIERDSAIAAHFKIRLLAPFLDDGMIKFAMEIDPKLKVSADDKKIILKEAALSLGLEKEFASRKKKAAQYGSYFHQAIGKLARKNGFKYKKDYLKSLLG